MFHLGERFIFSLFTEVSVMVFFMSIAFTERITWTCRHFASISYGKSVAIAITGIPSYHTFVQSVCKMLPVLVVSFLSQITRLGEKMYSSTNSLCCQGVGMMNSSHWRLLKKQS